MPFNSFLHSCGFNIQALPLVSPQLLACIVIWVQCLGFTSHLSTTSCAHLVSISNFPFPQCASQLPAIHLVSYVGFPRWLLHNFLRLCCFNIRFSPAPLCLSATSCIHVVSNTSASPVSEQLLPLIWFQYLTSPPMCLSSNFLTFLHSLGFKIYTLQEMQRPSPCDTLGSPPRSSWKHPHLGIHLVSISKLPPFVPLSNFLRSFSWSQDFPFGPFTTFCMHLHVVCMSQLPPVSQRLLALIWFQYLTSPPCASHQIPELPASLSSISILLP